MENNIILSKYIGFDAKPDAVPYKYRLTYRISLTCLIIRLTSSRSGCSLTKIHLITIAMYSQQGMENLIAYLENKNSNFIMLRFDPAVNKTIDFMLSDNIIYQQKNMLFKLTDKGKKYTQKLLKDGDLLIEERKFLENIDNTLPESKINDISKTLLG